MTPPALIMLAGPNGAGKTTFFNTFLKDKDLPLISADQISKELRLDPYDASAYAQSIREKLLSHRESFISETVFSDPVGAKLNFLKSAVTEGYSVTLIYIGIESIALSKARVASRVEAGGHNVPDEKLVARRNKPACFTNKSVYLGDPFIHWFFTLKNKAAEDSSFIPSARREPRPPLVRQYAGGRGSRRAEGNSFRVSPI